MTVGIAARVGSEMAQVSAETRGSRWSGVFGFAALVSCGIGVFVFVQAVGPEHLRDAVAATGVLAPISGSPLRLTAGALFGFWDGWALSVLGTVLGGCDNFWITRRFGRSERSHAA